MWKRFLNFLVITGLKIFLILILYLKVQKKPALGNLAKFLLMQSTQLICVLHKYKKRKKCIVYCIFQTPCICSLMIYLNFQVLKECSEKHSKVKIFSSISAYISGILLYCLSLNVYDLYTTCSLINFSSLHFSSFTLLMLLSLSYILVDLMLTLYFYLCIYLVCLLSLNFQSCFVTLSLCVPRNNLCLDFIL